MRSASDTVERETPAGWERDPLIEALDRRLAVDPALVDLDDLPLREAVMRICADLGITPDWSHWAAGDWMVSDPPADGAPRQAVPAPPRKGLARSVIQGLSAPIVQPPETAISLALQAGPFAPPWLPPRPG